MLEDTMKGWEDNGSREQRGRMISRTRERTWRTAETMATQTIRTMKTMRDPVPRTIVTMRRPWENLSNAAKAERDEREMLRGREEKTCLICSSSYYGYIYKTADSENEKLWEWEADRREWKGGITSRAKEDLKLKVVEVGTKCQDNVASRSINWDMIERWRSGMEDFQTMGVSCWEERMKHWKVWEECR